MDWLSTINSVIALITGLCGIIGTGIATYFAVRNFIKAFKEKDKSEKWSLIMAMADAAMKEAERSGKDGADKKEMVISTIKASCDAAGLDVSEFLDAVSAYIDETIKFVNEITKK